MIRVLRKPGPITQKNFRGVLLSSVPGKSISRVVRKMVMPVLEQAATDGQCGGRKGRSAAFCSSTTKYWFARCRRKGRAGAVLFADCKAAFYRALADEALGPVTTEQQRAAVCEAMGVSIADMLALEERVAAGGLLGMKDLPEPWLSLIAE